MKNKALVIVPMAPIFVNVPIHEMLKDGKCICKAKGHHHILKMAIPCTKCNFPFVTFSNTHQVICTTQIDLGVHLGMIQNQR